MFCIILSWGQFTFICRVKKTARVYESKCEEGKLWVWDRQWEGGKCVNVSELRMKEWGHTLRAIPSCPTGEALAGAIDGVAGAVVGAEANLSTSPTKPSAWTDCKTPHTHTIRPDLHRIKKVKPLTLWPVTRTRCWAHVWHKQTQSVTGFPLMDEIVLFEWIWSEVICLDKRRR